MRRNIPLIVSDAVLDDIDTRAFVVAALAGLVLTALGTGVLLYFAG